MWTGESGNWPRWAVWLAVVVILVAGVSAVTGRSPFELIAWLTR